MTCAATIEAVVQVGADVTRYLRCGRGPQMMVVLADDAEERRLLIEHFCPRYCVIAPIPYTADATSDDASCAVGHWLLGVIDGLGLDHAILVVTPEFTRVAERCAEAFAEVITTRDPHARALM